jgi:hypothetical protein
MRVLMSIAASLVVVFCSTLSLSADQKAFVGRWNLTGTGAYTDHIYWLEVKDEGGKLSGKFLNRGGSPVPVESIKVENDELIFTIAGRQNAPAIEHRAKLERGKLVGSTTERGTAIQWVGVRPPTWPPTDANAKHAYGKPIELFDGKSIDAFDLQHKDRPSGWTVVDGAMTNEPRANNLISKQKFKDYKIQAEYKLEKDSNSGIYQRGRYELQVVDDYGKPAESHGHMAIYAWVAPKVNASKPAGEWQTMEAVVVGNKVTVTLNGQKVHDNATIEAITGGALDANETAPGPIMLQGDHGKVWYRKVTVTPIVGAGS